MDRSALSHITSSLNVVVIIYGATKLISEFGNNIIPFGVILAFVLTGALYYFKLPFPKEPQVESILGKDLNIINPDEKSCFAKRIAHRGAGIDVPENTLAAYKYCKEKGCFFIELDVTITKDGVPIIFHDNSTGRLTDQDLQIDQTNWIDLKKLNLSIKHPNRLQFPDTRIPTLDEAIVQLLEDGQRIFIDIKGRDPQLIEIILNIYKKYPELYSKALITSFFSSMIYRVRRRDPRIIGALAWSPNLFYFAARESGDNISQLQRVILHITDVVYEWLFTRFVYFITGCSVILLHRYAANIKNIWDWRKRRGIRVIAWTVNNPMEKKYFTEILKIPYLTDTLDEGVTDYCLQCSD